MAYQPTVWARGDVVTSAKLNKLENGVKATGEALYVELMIDGETGALNKTLSEMVSAANSGNRVIVGYNGYYGELFYSDGDNWYGFEGNLFVIETESITAVMILAYNDGSDHIEISVINYAGGSPK